MVEQFWRSRCRILEFSDLSWLIFLNFEFFRFFIFLIFIMLFRIFFGYYKTSVLTFWDEFYQLSISAAESLRVYYVIAHSSPCVRYFPVIAIYSYLFIVCPVPFYRVIALQDSTLSETGTVLYLTTMTFYKLNVVPFLLTQRLKHKRLTSLSPNQIFQSISRYLPKKKDKQEAQI